MGIDFLGHVALLQQKELLLRKLPEIKANMRRKPPYLGSINHIGCTVLAAVGTAN